MKPVTCSLRPTANCETGVNVGFRCRELVSVAEEDYPRTGRRVLVGSRRPVLVTARAAAGQLRTRRSASGVERRKRRRERSFEIEQGMKFVDVRQTPVTV